MKNKKNTINNLINECYNLNKKIVPEYILKNYLKEYGLDIPAGRLCRTLAETEKFTSNLKGPFVLKLASDALLHKTEHGGVRLGIEKGKNLKDNFLSMDKFFKRNKIKGYEGIYIEEQILQGIEIIAGLQFDPVFGPVMMIGAGGVMTDIYKDVIFRAVPLTKKEISASLKQLKSWPLIKGFRGKDGADLSLLVDALYGISRFGYDAAGLYESADFNPVIAGKDFCAVADAKMILLKNPDRNFNFNTPADTSYLEKFFNPASVVVIGASPVSGKIGNAILDSLLNLEYKGTVYPVNPKYSDIMGKVSYPTLSALPETPDLVIVAVDLELVPSILSDMSAKGSHNLLIISGGGKELGGKRADIEENIKKIAFNNNIRIIGPNCIGMFDGSTRFDSFFYPKERLVRPGKGSISFITQSGTWGCSFLECASLSGAAKMVSYGNRVDVDEADLITFLAEDPETKVIGSYVEGLSSGRKFLSAVKKVRENNKPVVMFKTGRNPVSAKASISHTGAYGGSYQLYQGVLEQHGVILTNSFHECFAACETLSLQPVPKGNRVALLSNGAGPMVNAIDLFPGNKLELAKLEKASVKSMKEKFSFFYIPENPVDVTGSASSKDYEFVITTLLEDKNVDIIMPFFVFQNNPLDESIISILENINNKKRKPIVCCSSEGVYSEKMSGKLREAGIPVYTIINQWVAAAAALAAWSSILKK